LVTAIEKGADRQFQGGKLKKPISRGRGKLRNKVSPAPLNGGAR